MTRQAIVLLLCAALAGGCATSGGTRLAMAPSPQAAAPYSQGDQAVLAEYVQRLPPGTTGQRRSRGDALLRLEDLAGENAWRAHRGVLSTPLPYARITGIRFLELPLRTLSLSAPPAACLLLCPF